MNALRRQCKTSGLTGFSKLSKDELIVLLNQNNITPSLLDTNETFGLTCERLICEIAGIHFPEKMQHRTSETRLTIRLRENVSQVLTRLFDEEQIKVVEYCGNLNNAVDFLLSNNQTLSLKSNLTSDKICPQKIGQTTKKKFDSHFGVEGDRKQWIKEHIESILNEYAKHTFCCDYLLWIQEQTGECRLFKRPEHFDFPNLTFTRSLSDWNESNTVKCDGQRLGEFQMHSRRDCVKFRFNLRTLLKLDPVEERAKTEYTINYIGSKKSLLHFLDEVICKYVDFNTLVCFGDAFSGTGSVGKHFKNAYGCKGISTDTERYSWLLNHVMLNVPCTDRLKELCAQLCSSGDQSGFVGLFANTYSPVGERLFFTIENAKKIDYIRTQIEALKDTIEEDEYYFLLASLLVATDRVANISCVYGAFLKQFKKSAKNALKLLPVHTNATTTCSHTVYHRSVFDVDWSECTVLYLDPPYNQRQYGANYFPLNFLIEYSPGFETRGKTGLFEYYKSPFSQKTECLKSFELLLEHVKRVPVIFLSYNNEGIVTKTDLQQLLMRYGTVHLYIKPYKKFKAQKNVEKDTVEEYLWVLQTTLEAQQFEQFAI